MLSQDQPDSNLDASQSGSIRILLGEDNPVIQKVIQRLLMRLGQSCTIAEDGLQVLDALESTNYDLIFMDMEMPRMGGLQATRRIRQLDWLMPQPVIIALTANGETHDEQACLAAGMDGYLSKPVHMDQLREALTTKPRQRPFSELLA